MEVNEEKVIFNVLNAMKYPAEAPNQCKVIFEKFEDKLLEESEEEKGEEEQGEEDTSMCEYVGAKHELLNLNNRIHPAQEPSLDEAPKVELKVLWRI